MKKLFLSVLAVVLTITTHDLKALAYTHSASMDMGESMTIVYILTGVMVAAIVAVIVLLIIRKIKNK